MKIPTKRERTLTNLQSCPSKEKKNTSIRVALYDIKAKCNQLNFDLTKRTNKNATIVKIKLWGNMVLSYLCFK